MIFIETSTGQHLRPVHMLLMLYRYISGVYLLGDVAALNYVKGFLDGYPRSAKLARILAIAGHGIGEPELWLSDCFPDCRIDSLSFRLLDTQLIQFLRSGGAQGVEHVFARFQEIVAPLTSLAALLDDRGLVPYWQLQALAWSDPRRFNVKVHSEHPLHIPGDLRYDFIYASHSSRYLSADALAKLRRHLNPGSWLAVLTPAISESENGRFADSPLVRSAKLCFNQLLGARGYPLVQDSPPPAGLTDVASRREHIGFSVPAPTKALLVGELLLFSMHEHLSDRVRLEVLNETLQQFETIDVGGKEILELLMIGVESHDH